MMQTESITKDYLGYFNNLCDRERPLIWVASISKDGRPHLVPTCFVKPISEDKIAIGCVFIKQTVRNVLRNSMIALSSVKFVDGYNGFMIKGNAQVKDSGNEFESMKKWYLMHPKGRESSSGFCSSTSRMCTH